MKTCPKKPVRASKATNLYLPADLLAELKTVRKADESVSQIVAKLLAEEVALRQGISKAGNMLAKEIKRRG